MKRIFALMLSLTVLSFGFAQDKGPVQWEFSAKKISETVYEVYFTAKLEDGWHVYSQSTPDGGPIPTRFDFVKNPLLTFTGGIKELGKKEQKFEELFGVDVIQFSDKVVFVQQVQIRGKVRTALNGTVEFMSCNDRECMPPAKEKFSIILK